MRKSFELKILFFILFVSLGQGILYLEKLPYIDIIYSNIRLILFPIILVLTIKTRIHWNILFSLFGLYFLIILLSSLNHHSQSLVPLFSLLITSMSFTLSMIVGAKIDFSKTLVILRNVFNIYVYINFFFILLYPNGIWRESISSGAGDIGRYLIGGNYNQMGAVLIVSLVISSIYYYYTNRGKVFVILNIIVSIISLVIVGSKTSLVGILIFTIFLLLRNKRKKSRLILYCFIAFYILFQFQVVFLLTDLSKNGLASYFIEDILQKDTSFSMRTNIWLRSSWLFVESPIYGWGFQDKDWYENNIGGVSTHNYIYSILLKGGILLLFVFILMLLYLLKKERNYRQVYTVTAMFGLWVLLFMMIMEVYNIIYLLSMVFMIYITVCHSKTLNENKHYEKIKYNYPSS